MMFHAIADYDECRKHIIGFYSDRYALLGEIEDDLDDAYDYLQDFLREGLKQDASEGLFWAAFGLAMHLIPGGSTYAHLTKTLSVVKDAQPVFSKIKGLRGPFTGLSGKSNGKIEAQKKRIESRIKAIMSLVEVTQQGEPRGAEVKNALAHLDKEEAKLQKVGVCKPMLSQIKRDIGNRLPSGWIKLVDQLNLDYIFTELLIVHYVRNAVVAEKILMTTGWSLSGINDDQEKYIYDRAKYFRSGVKNADDIITRWGLATAVHNPRLPTMRHKVKKKIPFEKWPKK